MKSPQLLAVALAASVLATTASAQIIWASYNTSGVRQSENAATFDPQNHTYTFTVPAGQALTFVASSGMLPITLNKPVANGNIYTITFQQKASVGWTNVAGGNRTFNIGIFKDSGTAPGASGNFTDDVGLWANIKGGTTWQGTELFGGISPNTGLIGPYNGTQKLGSGKKDSSGTYTMLDDTYVNNIFRISSNTSGNMGMGTSSTIGVAGLETYAPAEAASYPTLTNYHTIYSSYTANCSCAAGSITFNEFALYFYNSVATGSTFTIRDLVGVEGKPFFKYAVGQPPSMVKDQIGSNVTIACEVDATCTTVSYQWKKSATSGGPYTDVPGANTATLSLNTVSTADNGYYIVTISNAAGSNDSTECFAEFLTDPVDATVTQDPADTIVPKGSAATLSHQSYGSAPLSYQWQYCATESGTYTDIPGATNKVLIIGTTAVADTGYYHVVVSNTKPSSDTSASAYLLVTEPADITVQPVGSILDDSASYTLETTVTGSPAPTFQWQKSTDNGATYTNIDGATTEDLDFTSVSASDVGWYRLVVTNHPYSNPADVYTKTSNRAYIGVRSASFAPSSYAPAASASGLDIDAPISITFPSAPKVGSYGTVTIKNAGPDLTVGTADDVTVETINLTTCSIGVGASFLEGVPYSSKTIGGFAGFSYYPLMVSGNTVSIYPAAVLAYNTTYYVQVSEGAILDASNNATWTGLIDTSWTFSTKAAATHTLPNIAVAADGSGDFCTIQAALDAAGSGGTVDAPVVISIANGTYTEMLAYGPTKSYVSLVGESRAGVNIEYPTNGGINPTGSPYRRSVVIFRYCTGITVDSLTITNTSAYGALQAEALIMDGTGSPSVSRGLVKNVALYSFQDTLQINGQAYVYNCSIWGDTDFLWGTGPCYFKDCTFTMYTRPSNPCGYYTQIRNGASNHGYIFASCNFFTALNPNFTLDAALNSGGPLGRTDQNVPTYTEVVLLDCILDDTNTNAQLLTDAQSANDIQNVGWTLNGAVATDYLVCAEYNSLSLDGVTPANTTQRPAWSRQLSSEQAHGQASFLRGDGVTPLTYNYYDVYAMLANWAPRPVIGTAPSGTTIDAGAELSLSVGATTPLDDTLTYQWYKDGAPIDSATGSTYTVNPAAIGDSGTYTVAVTNAAGTTTSAGAVVCVQETYAAWATTAGLDAGNNAAIDDPDGDGIPNLLECALGGDPLDNDKSIQPVSSRSGTSIVYEYNVNTRSQVVVTPQYSTDLETWDPAVDGVGGVTIVEGAVDAGGIKHVTVTIQTAGANMYCRLLITQ